jgi:hypothetical protein
MHKQVCSIAGGSIFGVMRIEEAIDTGLVGRTPAVSAVRGYFSCVAAWAGSGGRRLKIPNGRNREKGCAISRATAFLWL